MQQLTSTISGIKRMPRASKIALIGSLILMIGLVSAVVVSSRNQDARSDASEGMRVACPPILTDDPNNKVCLSNQNCRLQEIGVPNCSDVAKYAPQMARCGEGVFSHCQFASGSSACSGGVVRLMRINQPPQPGAQPQVVVPTPNVCANDPTVNDPTCKIDCRRLNTNIDVCTKPRDSFGVSCCNFYPGERPVENQLMETQKEVAFEAFSVEKEASCATLSDERSCRMPFGEYKSCDSQLAPVPGTLCVSGTCNFSSVAGSRDCVNKPGMIAPASVAYQCVQSLTRPPVKVEPPKREEGRLFPLPVLPIEKEKQKPIPVPTIPPTLQKLPVEGEVPMRDNMGIMPVPGKPPMPGQPMPQPYFDDRMMPNPGQPMPIDYSKPPMPGQPMPVNPQPPFVPKPGNPIPPPP